MRTEDGSIIHRCLNGEPEVLGLLVDKYKAGIYAFAYTRLRDFRDAQDVTQEVFVQAFRDLHSLRRWESFVFWLYRIASTHCGKWIRARSRRPDQEFIEDQTPETLERPSVDSYRENQVSKSLRERLASLPETYREVLTLYYFGGHEQRGLARALGMSPAAVRKRLSRARAQLKEEMVAMMNTAYEGQRLRTSFTFRIVEVVKRIKVNPMPRATALPWGLSFAAGIIITMFSLSPYLNILNPSSIPVGSPLPVEVKVLKTGEIPVDVLKISQIPAFASKQGDGSSGRPNPRRTYLLAPATEEGTWAKKADMPTARFSLSASVVNGRIYVIGGWQAFLPGAKIAAVEEYNPATNTWTAKADMPTPRQGLSTCVIGGKIYAVGGWTIEPDEPCAIVEEYNTGFMPRDVISSLNAKERLLKPWGWIKSD